MTVREIVLAIAPLCAPGTSAFAVPADDESVAVRYEARGPGHRVTIAPSCVRFRMGACGANAPLMPVAIGPASR